MLHHSNPALKNQFCFHPARMKAILYVLTGRSYDHLT